MLTRFCKMFNGNFPNLTTLSVFFNGSIPYEFRDLNIRLPIAYAVLVSKISYPKRGGFVVNCRIIVCFPNYVC